MEQAVSSLRAGHMTAGIDVGVHGGHSTDGKPNEQQYMFHYVFHTLRVVLPEASQYQAREEYTTLNEKVKQVSKLCSSLQYELGVLHTQLLDLAHSPAARLHYSLIQAVQMEWFPAMCNGFVVISPELARKLPSPRTRSVCVHFGMLYFDSCLPSAGLGAGDATSVSGGPELRPLHPNPSPPVCPRLGNCCTFTSRRYVQYDHQCNV